VLKDHAGYCLLVRHRELTSRRRTFSAELAQYLLLDPPRILCRGPLDGEATGPSQPQPGRKMAVELRLTPDNVPANADLKEAASIPKHGALLADEHHQIHEDLVGTSVNN